MANYKGKGKQKSYQKKKEFKKEFKDKSAVTTKSGLAVVAGVGSHPVSAINKLLVSTTAAEMLFGVTHLSVDISSRVLAYDDMALTLYSEAISAYSSARGYGSGVSPSDIASYLGASMDALSALVVLWRQQNLAKSVDKKGVSIAGLYSKVVTNGYNAISIDALDSRFVAVTELGVGSISNAEWQQTYLSALSKIRLPKTIVDMIVYLYGHVFVNTFKGSDVDADVVFWPDNILGAGALTTPQAAFNNAITTIDGLIAADPDLIAIMEFLDFKADEVMNLDFTRDLKGQTIHHVNDPMLGTMMINSFTFINGVDSADVPQSIEDTVFLPFYMKHAHDYLDILAMPVDILPYTTFFRNVVRLGNLNTIDNDNDQTNYIVVPQGYIDYPSSAITATGADRLLNITLLQDITSKMFGDLNPFLISYTPNDTNLAVINETISSAYGFSGYNSISVPEVELDGLNDVYVVSLLFGPNYRENITSKIKAINDYIIRG